MGSHAKCLDLPAARSALSRSLPSVQLPSSFACSSFMGTGLVPFGPLLLLPRVGSNSIQAKYYKLGRPRKLKKGFWEKKDKRYKTVGNTLVYWPYNDQLQDGKAGLMQKPFPQDGSNAVEAEGGLPTRGPTHPKRGTVQVPIPSLTPTARRLWEQLTALPEQAPIQGVLRLKVAEGVVTGADMVALTRLLQNSKHWDKRAKVLQWWLASGPWPFGVSQWCALVESWCAAGQLEAGLACYRRMREGGLRPRESTFVALLSAMGRRKQPQQAEALFQAMKREGFPQGRRTYTALLTAYARSGDGAAAEQVFRELQSVGGMVPDVVACNALMHAWSTVCQPESAARVMRCMLANKVRPNMTTYNTMLAAYARSGDVIAAEAVMRQLQEAGYGPSVVTYNTLLGLYSRKGLVARAEAVFAVMQEAGCAPSLHSYTTLVAAYGRAGRPDQAERCFRQIKHELGVEPDLRAYNALLDAFGKAAEVTRVEQLLATMSSSGVSPSAESWTILLDACGKAGQPGPAADVLRRMTEGGIAPGVVEYTALLDAFVKAGESTAASSLLHEMHAHGLPFTPEMLTVLLHSHARNRTFQAGLQLLARSPVDPSTAAFNALLHGFAEAGLADNAERLVDQMAAAGCRPDARTFNTLVLAHAQANSLDAAESVLQRMRAAGVSPDHYTFNPLILAYARAGQPSQVARLLRDMRISHRLKPCEVTRSAVWRGGEAALVPEILHELGFSADEAKGMQQDNGPA